MWGERCSERAQRQRDNPVHLGYGLDSSLPQPALPFCYAKWLCPCMGLFNPRRNAWKSQGVLSLYLSGWGLHKSSDGIWHVACQHCAFQSVTLAGPSKRSECPHPLPPSIYCFTSVAVSRREHPLLNSFTPKGTFLVKSKQFKCRTGIKSQQRQRHAFYSTGTF